MPKAEPHFDQEALLRFVSEQDIGLRVSTNDPAGFRRILYKEMREQPDLRCRILQCPKTPRAFLLMKTNILLPQGAQELPDPGADVEEEETDA